MTAESRRMVSGNKGAIYYLLEQKDVKNLNLRIHRDGSIYVSASPLVPADKIDDFVLNKQNFIYTQKAKFDEITQFAPKPKKYVSGETFQILGKGIRLKVKQAEKEEVYCDGVYLYLCVKDPLDFVRKEKLVTGYINSRCRDVFCEIMTEIYPTFQKYGVEYPDLRIRTMDTRWGSCLKQKGIITLNKRLIEAPRNCIEYVVMHEYCHFIHPDHSKLFYGFLAMLMPDLKERKTVLDKYADYWL